MELGQVSEFSVSVDRGLLYQGWLCIPTDSGFKGELLAEAHSSPFLIHSGNTKMYQDLKRYYWWFDMKREIVDYVSKCLVCQQVKALRTTKGSSVIWIIVDMLTKVAHFIPGKPTYSMNKWAQLYMKEIVRLLTDRQIKCLNQTLEDMLRTCALEFSGSWDCIWWSSHIITVIKLPLACRHLKLCTKKVVGLLFAELRYVTDLSHVVDFEPLHLNENLSYEEKPIQIFAREVKVLRNREVLLMKALWQNHQLDETILEREDGVRAQYSELVQD
ncbi:uncharacterized protein LOC120077185 [Benincasa hispida]|uniref:uncharacterized protein LOC120077185 n=1 Tax=Benincasa hispida TaxID=102211 RepID=UPI0018FF4D86|nr:uncharacterized protein LOC120077185 [Benincasa hispida]